MRMASFRMWLICCGLEKVEEKKTCRSVCEVVSRKTDRERGRFDRSFQDDREEHLRLGQIRNSADVG